MNALAKFLKLDGREKRADDLTEQIIAHREALLSGEIQALNRRNAVIEAAIGLIERTVSKAKVTGNEITHNQLCLITREMLTKGESVLHENRIASEWTVTSDKQGEYRYQLYFDAPSTQKQSPTRNRATVSGLTAKELAHFKYSTDAKRQWVGVSPIERAQATIAALGFADIQLIHEFSRPNGTLYEIGEGADSTKLQPILKTIKNLKGKFGLLPTGRVRGSATHNVSNTKIDLRADPSEATSDVYGKLEEVIWAAFGIPQAIINRPSRENYRNFVHTTVKPMLANIEATLNAYLPSFSGLDSSELEQSDITAKARAVKQLTDAGMQLQDALKTVGL